MKQKSCSPQPSRPLPYPAPLSVLLILCVFAAHKCNWPMPSPAGTPVRKNYCEDGGVEEQYRGRVRGNYFHTRPSTLPSYPSYLPNSVSCTKAGGGVQSLSPDLPPSYCNVSNKWRAPSAGPLRGSFFFSVQTIRSTSAAPCFGAPELQCEAWNTVRYLKTKGT